MERASDFLRSLPQDELRFAPPQIGEDDIIFRLEQISERMTETVGQLRLTSPRQAPPYHRRASRSFSILIHDFVGGDERIISRLVLAAKAVSDNDDGTFARYSPHPDPAAQAAPTASNDSRPDFLPFVLVVLAWLASSTVSKTKGWSLRGLFSATPPVGGFISLKLSHAIPTVILGAIFLYWSLYWPGVAMRLPSMALQLLYALALEACLSRALGQPWSFKLAVFPIVLGANIFTWFASPAAVFLVVTLAVASKALIRRGGRHIFNPSAFGLAVGGVLSLWFPTFGYHGLFHPTNLAPHMSELILILALIPQFRFPIVLASIGGLLGLIGSRWLDLFPSGPGLSYPQIILALSLFMTDPATIPQKPAGKLAYGLFVGFGINFFSWALRQFGFPDEFSKVYPIPLANALVPLFDRIGTWRLLDWPLLHADSNRWHMAVWLALMVPLVREEKVRNFEAALHWNYQTPQVVFGSGDVPRCAENPVFCAAFDFLGEARLWASNRPSPDKSHE